MSMTTIREVRLRRKVPRKTQRIYPFLSIVFVLLSLITQETHAVRSPESYSARTTHSLPTISKDTTIHKDTTTTTTTTTTDNKVLSPRGGAKASVAKRPPIAWAILHNWLYFLSLAFNLLNVPFLIREIVDGKGTNSNSPSPQSIKLSGNVEAVDKLLTFCGVAFLSALSDQHGRKPLIAWSSFGFAFTNLLQVLAGKAPTLRTSKILLYVADFVDGISSCMTPVCQAYVADCTVGSASLASNLGVFQGISIGGAFCIAFPIGGMLGAKYGPRLPILLAAGFQILNGLIAVFVTPESNRRAIKSENQKPAIDLSEVNPIRGLQNLFGIGNVAGFGSSSKSLLRAASLAYFCLSMARNSLDAQFVNYSNIRFGWSQAQSGPVLVMVGMMMGVVPRILVPLLGLQKCIHYGLLILGMGLSLSGLASTQQQYIASFAIVSIGFGTLRKGQNKALDLFFSEERE